MISDLACTQHAAGPNWQNRNGMISINDELLRLGLKSSMIMTVHDELVFDVPRSEITFVPDIIKSCMESVVKLDAPLIADVDIRKNWAEKVIMDE